MRTMIGFVQVPKETLAELCNRAIASVREETSHEIERAIQCYSDRVRARAAMPAYRRIFTFSPIHPNYEGDFGSESECIRQRYRGTLREFQTLHDAASGDGHVFVSCEAYSRLLSWAH